MIETEDFRVQLVHLNSLRVRVYIGRLWHLFFFLTLASFQITSQTLLLHKRIL